MIDINNVPEEIKQIVRLALLTLEETEKHLATGKVSKELEGDFTIAFAELAVALYSVSPQEILAAEHQRISSILKDYLDFASRIRIVANTV